MKLAKLIARNFEELMCAAFVVCMIGLVTINVFLRYLLDYSIVWSEEVATICFVWCVFIGASATYKNKMDMGIDLLVTQAPERAASVIRLITRLILLILNGYIFTMAIIFTSIAWSKPTAVLGISSAVFNSALVVSFGLITIHTFRFFIDDLSHLYRKKGSE